MRRHGLNRSVSGCGQVAGSCECGNELLWFHKMRGISRVAVDLLAYQEGL
jgi:hypothetical protein